MARHRLTNAQWELIAGEFGSAKPTGRPRVERRKVLDGIFWIMRTGSPWRDLPDEFGAWQTTWRLFDQWNREGKLDRILSMLRRLEESNEELWCVDGTVVRAAKCAAGGGKKGPRKSRTIMRSGAAVAV
jgi:transposase